MKLDDEFKAMANGLNIISKLKAAKLADATRITELEAEIAAERARAVELEGEVERLKTQYEDYDARFAGASKSIEERSVRLMARMERAELRAEVSRVEAAAERALSDRLANALWWYHTGMGCKTDREALDAIDAARADLTAHTEARTGDSDG